VQIEAFRGRTDILEERSQFLLGGGSDGSSPLPVGLWFGGPLGFERGAGGGVLLELFQCTVIGTLSGVQAAVQTGEAFGFFGIRAPERIIVPYPRLDPAEAAEFPIGGD